MVCAKKLRSSRSRHYIDRKTSRDPHGTVSWESPRSITAPYTISTGCLILFLERRDDAHERRYGKTRKKGARASVKGKTSEHRTKSQQTLLIFLGCVVVSWCTVCAFTYVCVFS